MRERELRLGVVLTGGVSLALYIHGITRELQKLVRASRAFHARAGTAGAVPESYRDETGSAERVTDTEPVYFDLLKALTPELDLRIIIDVIAGSSAGGVNGVMLGRALAHDLNLEPHRDLWLEHADVLHLIDEKASAGRWGKIYIAPIVSLLMRQDWLRRLAPEEETRSKLLTFLRSRWFQPPFSGPKFAAWLLDAGLAMENGALPDSSLLPDGHPLDLFISSTDFYGHASLMALHDPAEIVERDHRHVFRFRYHKPVGATPRSDFSAEEMPGLVFAARATSCFPGAFPPAFLREIDALLTRRKRKWPGRKRFIEEKLGKNVTGGRQPELIRFIDGSVVNDKPFAAAISAIADRPAHREVARRLIFVETAPRQLADGAETSEPGFARTLIAALAEIPNIEPIRDEIARIDQANRHVRAVNLVLQQTRPMIDPFVDSILPADLNDPPSQEAITGWRDKANEEAALSAGYAFHGYFRLKLVSVANGLRRLVASLAWPEGMAGLSKELRPAFYGALQEMGVAVSPDLPAQPSSAASDVEIGFLRSFDVDFRVRRMRFVIRRLNGLYTVAAQRPELELRTDLLDELKATLHDRLGLVRRRWDAAFYDGEIGRALAAGGEGPGAVKAFAQAISEISRVMDLVTLDREIDEVFSMMVLNYMPGDLRRELFASYLGFSFFDVMSFPMVQWEDLDEFEEILIDRISPADATAIREGGAGSMLKGLAMRHFGGFFNRAYRENDYLWGRLNAADRLIDIVIGCVRETETVRSLDVPALKNRIFKAILDSEEGHLEADPDLVPGLRSELAERYGETGG